MGLLTEAAIERAVDQDFDQTAPHIHDEDTSCPTCHAVAGYHEPTILERRILELEEDVRQRDLRIKAFEQFTANLSAHIDGMHKAVEQAIKPRAEYPRAA